MNWDEYNILFHKLNLNRVAFKEVIDCSEEILTLVNAAIDAAAQEKKPWVGLTDDEKQEAYLKIDTWDACVSFIEVKLKEKNT
jgi:hypothetical protein